MKQKQKQVIKSNLRIWFVHLIARLVQIQNASSARMDIISI